MRFYVSLAAARLNPTGTKILGWDVCDPKTGHPMLSRGAGGTQASIRESIGKIAKSFGPVDFVLHLQNTKTGEETSQTTRYQWNGSEAVPV